MKCRQEYEVEVLKSGAGYYIGTLDEMCCPNCRLSQNYYKTKEEAQKVLDTLSFATRSYAMEIEFCNGGKGCIVG